MLFHVLGHVDADEGLAVAVYCLGEGAAELGLADAGGAEENEAAHGPARVGEADAPAADGPGDGGDGLVLAYDAAVQGLLEAQEPCALGLGDGRGRHARPGRDHVRDVGGLDAAPGLGPVLEPHMRGGLVQEVYGLVRQEAVADVAGREAHGGAYGLVRDAQAVVGLERGAQGAEHALAVLRVRLRHVHGLEAALEGGVLFDVLAVFLGRGGADDLDLAPAQGGLEDVRGVDGALCGARANDGVQLVDEDDDVPGALDLLDDAFDPVLEVTAILGAGEHGGEVEGYDAAVFEGVGHFAAGDAAGEALGHGGLADAGLADEDGVVLGSA